MYPRFWRNKKVLVTGHTGFKGSWLCLWLTQMGAKVTGVALPPLTKPSLFLAANVEDILERSVILDIRDSGKLMHFVRQVKPQIVFHMAAQPLVLDSYKDPVGTYATNVMGMVNLFEAIRVVSSVRAVINVTTDKCYENMECTRRYREEDPLGGFDPYSSSKACSEIVTAAYRRAFFNPDDYKKHGVAVATARAGNVIGGGDWARDRLVPDCIRALIKGEDIILRNPQAVRPWQHVLEPLCGYLMLAEKLFVSGPKFASAWNFGPDKGDLLTVKQVADRICHQWGGSIKVKLSPGRHPHEARLLMLDIAKAKKELGWRPRMSVTQAFNWTIDGYLGLVQKENARAVILQQINSYNC
jgi:CDP-glucose 4,6-dehydratase